MILMGLIFIRRMQPIFIVRSLILIVLLYSYMIYIIMGSYWFRYALVIVILRGVLVVFTYMVRLIPNERFENYNLLYMIGVIIFLIGRFYVWIYDLKMGIISLNLWRRFFGIFNIFIVIVLLRIMLVVVWLRYIGFGALRVG